jgi:hypothetical protein
VAGPPVETLAALLFSKCSDSPRNRNQESFKLLDQFFEVRLGVGNKCNSIRERESLKANACGLLRLSRWSTGTSNTLTSPKGHSTARHKFKGTFLTSFDTNKYGRHPPPPGLWRT